ncbi:MAG: phosphotransferase [Acidimicrobiales bacterium]
MDVTLADHLPHLLGPTWGRVRVVAVEPGPLGPRCATWRVVVQRRRLFSSGPTTTLVVRVDAEAGSSQPALEEARLVTEVRSRGVPAPEVMLSGDATGPLGRSWWVRSLLPGTVTLDELADRPDLAAAQASIVGDCGRVLGQIHRLGDGLQLGRSADPGAVVSRLAQRGDWPSDVRPVVADLVSDLVAHAPPARHDHVVHGAVGPSTLLADAGGLVAVLDWDACAWGDPASDLGRLCATVGRPADDGAFASEGARDLLRAAHRAESGLDVSAEDVWWWEATHSLVAASALDDPTAVSEVIARVGARPGHRGDC